METILEGPCEMEFFTDLRIIFRAINGRQCDFNWLITDLEYRLFSLDHRPPLFVSCGPIWLSGDELSRLVDENDVQFSWAVLSGFPPSITLDPHRLDDEPYADGNPGFWLSQPRIQHPQADVEIVCWDSSCTILLCRDRSIGEDFRRHFPEAVDLTEYNNARLLGNK